MHPSTHARVLMFLFSIAVSAVAHAVLARWALSCFAVLWRHRRFVIAFAAAVVLVPPAMRWGALATRTDGASWFYALAITEGMFVAVVALPLVLVQVVAALSRTRRPRLEALAASGASVPSMESRGEVPPLVGRRPILEAVAGVAALGVTGTAFGWGMVRGRHAFTIEELVVKIPGLPRSLDGYTIAQVSDIHTGIFVGDRELAEGLSRARAIRPDLLVATGDLVDFDHRQAPRVARALAEVGARDGVIAILGNHDYYAGATNVADAIRAAGIEILVNAGKTVRPMDGGGFAVLGVDDLWGRRSGGPGPDLDRAIAMVPRDAPRILLSHQPRYLDEIAGRVALQLSGHMHGGQINPGFRPIDVVSRYVSGRYEKGGTTLWVNRGFGVAGPPVRLGAPPEVTKIVLIAA